jgi:hypothetical protein
MSDLTAATRGIGRDKQVIIDPRNPRNSIQHLGWLKQAVREIDNAWHDGHNNVLVRFSLELELSPSYRCRFSTLELVDISSQSPSFGLST